MGTPGGHQPPFSRGFCLSMAGTRCLQETTAFLGRGEKIVFFRRNSSEEAGLPSLPPSPICVSAKEESARAAMEGGQLSGALLPCLAWQQRSKAYASVCVSPPLRPGRSR